MIFLDYLGKMGQLGNQMFQYAALRGIAKHKGYDFGIPDHDELIVDALEIDFVLSCMFPLTYRI